MSADCKSQSDLSSSIVNVCTKMEGSGELQTRTNVINDNNLSKQVQWESDDQTRCMLRDCRVTFEQNDSNKGILIVSFGSKDIRLDLCSKGDLTCQLLASIDHSVDVSSSVRGSSEMSIFKEEQNRNTHRNYSNTHGSRHTMYNTKYPVDSIPVTAASPSMLEIQSTTPPFVSSNNNVLLNRVNSHSLLTSNILQPPGISTIMPTSSSSAGYKSFSNSSTPSEQGRPFKSVANTSSIFNSPNRLFTSMQNSPNTNIRNRLGTLSSSSSQNNQSMNNSNHQNNNLISSSAQQPVLSSTNSSVAIIHPVTNRHQLENLYTARNDQPIVTSYEYSNNQYSYNTENYLAFSMNNQNHMEELLLSQLPASTLSSDPKNTISSNYTNNPDVAFVADGEGPPTRKRKSNPKKQF